jgi:hypothetical protein
MVLELNDSNTHVTDEVRVHFDQVRFHHVLQLSGHLHTGGATAHHHKRQQLLLLLKAVVKRSGSQKTAATSSPETSCETIRITQDSSCFFS